MCQIHFCDTDLKPQFAQQQYDLLTVARMCIMPISEFLITSNLI